MLSLHNWGGTQFVGTADPAVLVDRLNVVVIGVDYLQSGPTDPKSLVPYDFGYLQALDALRALWFVHDGLAKQKLPFASGRIYAAGGSGGGNVSVMCNKLAPRTFACVVDMSGMAKLSDDIAYAEPGGSRLSARYSRDPASAAYLSPEAQEIRFVGNPEHLRVMKALGNRSKVIVSHGTTDDACPVADAREMAANLRDAGLDVEGHFITEADFAPGVVTNTGHSVGDRTKIVLKFAGRYLTPGNPELLVRQGPSDFERRDEAVRYPAHGGAFVISYKHGYPVGRFEKTGIQP
jgi:predicted esterase